MVLLRFFGRNILENLLKQIETLVFLALTAVVNQKIFSSTRAQRVLSDHHLIQLPWWVMDHFFDFTTASVKWDEERRNQCHNRGSYIRW